MNVFCSVFILKLKSLFCLHSGGFFFHFSPAAKSMMRHFAQMYFCEDAKHFLACYDLCMREYAPYAYLAVDFSVGCPNHLRLRTCLSESEGPTVFYVKSK